MNNVFAEFEKVCLPLTGSFLPTQISVSYIRWQGHWEKFVIC